MLSWSGKSKDATVHALPIRTNTYTLPVHLIHTPSLVTYPWEFKLMGQKLTLNQHHMTHQKKG